MLWSRSNPVWTGSVVAFLLLGLSLTPSSAARRESNGARGQSDRQEQQASSERSERPAREEPAPSRETVTVQPRRERGRTAAPTTSPPPNARAEQSSPSRPVWSRPNTNGTPPRAEPQGYTPSVSPSPKGRTWDRGAATPANPYQVYRQPRPRTLSESPTPNVRAKPAAPPPRPVDDTARTWQRAPAQNERPNPRVWGREAEESPGRVRQDRPQVQRPTQYRPGQVQDRVERPVNPRTATPGESRGTTPRARFSGPEAERNLRVVSPGQQTRLQQQLRESLVQRNRTTARSRGVRPMQDVLGNRVAADMPIVLRDRVSRISIGYRHVENRFGAPVYDYVIVPRSRLDYWDGYWDGYSDGYWAGTHRPHHSPVVIGFYYGYYWSDPYWLAFSYPGYYPSIYHYWGWCPAWVHPARTYIVRTEYVYAPSTPYRYYYRDYGVDYSGAARAIADVRRAWLDSDIDSLAYHLTDNIDIRVYFDGEYAYSTATEDYYAMTVDAMATTQTVAMDFNSPIWISTHEVFYTGRHVFYDPEGTRHTVYASYRLRRLGSEWYLVAVGTSLEPIRHQYTDFRYS